MDFHYDFEKEEQGEKGVNVEENATVGLVSAQKNENYTKDDGDT